MIVIESAYIQFAHCAVRVPEGGGPSSTGIEVLGFIHQGLIAVGSFILHAGEIVAEFYLKLWNTSVSAVQQAVEVVKSVVDAVVGWIKDMVSSALSRFLSPLISAIKGYQSGVAQAFYDAYLDYQNDGKLSEKSISGINRATKMEFLGALWALGAGLYGLFLVLMGATFGVGAIISVVIGFAVDEILQELFHTSDGKRVKGVTVNPDIGLMELVNLGEDFANSTGTAAKEEDPDVWEAAWRIIGVIAALWGVGFGFMGLELYLKFAKSDMTGFASGVGSLVYGILSLVFAKAAYDYWQNSDTISQFKAVLMDALAFVTGMLGLMLSIISTGLSILKTTPGWILGIGGLAFNLFSLYIAILR